MELRKLKELWDGSSNSSIPINEEELNQILNKRSRRPIAIIKRNLKLEVAFGILSYCFLIWVVILIQIHTKQFLTIDQNKLIV